MGRMKGNSLQGNRIENCIQYKLFWKVLPWSKFRQKLFLIQTQIFSCIKCKRFKQALIIQKFLLLSYEVYYVAIKEITQLRLDRKIFGLEQQLIRNSCQRLGLFFFLQEKLYKSVVKSARKIYLVDFLKGKTLIFMPDILDRIIQYIWASIIEPVFNSLFFEEQLYSCSRRKCLFAKYAVVLKLACCLESRDFQIFQMKYSFFSYFIPKFNSSYLLKSFFFPEGYKRCMLNSVNLNLIINATFFNEDLAFYLHKFHYFIFSLSIFGLNQLFSRMLKLKFATFSKNLKSSFYYFFETLYLLDVPRLENILIFGEFIRSYGFENALLGRLLSVVVKTSYSGFEFLDWNFKSLKQVCKIVPSYNFWLSYKTIFKRILIFTKYNIFQRIKLLEMWVETTVFQHWLCISVAFKKEFFILKIWLKKYFRTHNFVLNLKKTGALKKIFKFVFFTYG